MLIVSIVNVTGIQEQADYEYEVRVNNRVIRRGRIEDHVRSDGWPALVRLVAEDGFRATGGNRD